MHQNSIFYVNLRKILNISIVDKNNSTNFEESKVHNCGGKSETLTTNSNYISNKDKIAVAAVMFIGVINRQ